MPWFIKRVGTPLEVLEGLKTWAATSSDQDLHEALPVLVAEIERAAPNGPEEANPRIEVEASGHTHEGRHKREDGTLIRWRDYTEIHIKVRRVL